MSRVPQSDQWRYHRQIAVHCIWGTYTWFIRWRISLLCCLLFCSHCIECCYEQYRCLWWHTDWWALSGYDSTGWCQAYNKVHERTACCCPPAGGLCLRCHNFKQSWYIAYWTPFRSDHKQYMYVTGVSTEVIQWVYGFLLVAQLVDWVEHVMHFNKIFILKRLLNGAV